MEKNASAAVAAILRAKKLAAVSTKAEIVNAALHVEVLHTFIAH